MIKKTKKGGLPILKIILIVLTSSIILISYLVILIPSKTFTIDEKKFNTQIIIKKIISGNCFSDEYATINEDKFTQENLNSCLKGSENILLKTYILGGKSIYYDNLESEFLIKKKTCAFSSESNILCTDMRYPIRYFDKENQINTRILVVQIII